MLFLSCHMNILIHSFLSNSRSAELLSLEPLTLCPSSL